MKYKVTVISGAGAGRSFDITSTEARVGRAADCEVTLDQADDIVSQHHGWLSVKGDRLMFEDTSASGTFFQDRPVREQLIDTGMVLRLGRTGPELRFDLLEEGERSAPRPRSESVEKWTARSPAWGSYAPAQPGALSPVGYGSTPMAMAMPYGVPPGYGVAHAPFGYATAQAAERDAQERDQSQLKVLSIFYGIFAMLPLAGALITLLFALASINSSLDVAIFFARVAAVLGFGVLLDGLTAFALATHRWRTFCLIMSVLCCLEFPIGTVLGVCSLMVLTRSSTKRLFERKVATQQWMAPQWQQ